MEIPKDKVKKLYYSIAEVADMFNVNQSLLRFWEKEFPQIAPHTNSRGVRKYREEDIELLGMIYYLVKEKGMTIPGARQRLDNDKKAVRKNYDISVRLKRVRDELKSISNELEKLSASAKNKEEIG